MLILTENRISNHTIPSQSTEDIIDINRTVTTNSPNIKSNNLPHYLKFLDEIKPDQNIKDTNENLNNFMDQKTNSLIPTISEQAPTLKKGLSTSSIDSPNSLKKARPSLSIGSIASHRFSKLIMPFATILDTEQSQQQKEQSSPIVNEMLSNEKVRKFRLLRKMSMNANRSLMRMNSAGQQVPIASNPLPDTQQDYFNEKAASSWGVIHPESFVKVVWDILSMIFIVYQSIMVPFKISFNFESPYSLGLFEMIQDFYFIIDILVSLNTGFYLKGLIILTRKEIVLEYLRIWFWLDIAASFPYPLVISPEAYFQLEDSGNIKALNLLRFLKFMRLMRILRLLRIFKLKKLFVHFEDYLMNDTITLFIQLSKLLLICLFIAHFGGCFWFYLGYSEFQEFGKGWIINAQIVDADISVQYIHSLYYYIVTMFQVGYGDITPVTRNEKLFAMFNMLLACGVFAYIIGSLSNVLGSRYDTETNFKRRMLFLNEYLINKKIDSSLRKRIRKYLEHVLENKKDNKIDEKEVLSLLNKNLRDEICLHLNGQILKGFHAFNKFEEFCILLTYKIKEETLNPNEIIFDKGHESNRLFFITSGKVIICDKETKIIYKELEKTFFGEVGFFSRRPRIAAAESTSFLNVSYLEINDFRDYASIFRFSHRQKFENLRTDIEKILTSIRTKNFIEINLSCYMCDSHKHLAPECTKLRIFDEFYKLRFSDRKHKTETELEFIYKKFNRMRDDRQKDKKISLFIDTSVDNSVIFADAEEQCFFNDYRFTDNIEENSGFKDSNQASPIKKSNIFQRIMVNGLEEINESSGRSYNSSSQESKNNESNSDKSFTVSDSDSSKKKSYLQISQSNLSNQSNIEKNKDKSVEETRPKHPMANISRFYDSEREDSYRDIGGRKISEYTRVKKDTEISKKMNTEDCDNLISDERKNLFFNNKN